MSNLAKVAILLVVTNEAEYLPVFCNSVNIQNYASLKLFVLDNNCIDNSIEIIHSYIPTAIIIHSNENLGFARGNNLLAKEAIRSGFELLFILNPDIELHESCIKYLVKLINSDKLIGAVAPIIFFGRENKEKFKIQHYANHIDFKMRHVKSLHGNQIFVEGTLPEEIEVNVVGGGITFIKSSVVENIGLFEESYFIYGEEADLAYRSNNSGYIMKVTSKAKVWHHHDWSPKNKGKYYFSYYYINRSKILYFNKFGFYKSILISVLKDVLLFPLKVRWALKIADFRLIKFYYLGIFHGLLNKTGQSTVQFK